MPASLEAPLALDAHQDERVKQTAADVALEGFTGPGAPAENGIEEFAALRGTGSQLWLDTGDPKAIAPLWCREFSGLTTNNTLVNQVIQRGDLDESIPKAAERLKSLNSLSQRDLALELGFVANARVALGLVQRFGAKVSVELHPAMANDIEASLTFARRYYALCPERFIIKVPMQPAGFLVVRRLGEEGIPVNYTLGFSARQNYLATLFSRPGYVNVFLGRLNSVVDENGLGEPENIGEKTTLASQEAVKALKQKDPSVPTQQIAASVRNGQQIADLAGVDVFTMPPKAAQEFREKHLKAGDLELQQSGALVVSLNETPWRKRIEELWTISDEFKSYASEVSQQDTRNWSGEDFAAFTKEQGVQLFYDWTPEEIAQARADGKIPKVSKWSNAPLDELMSQSALQAFATDQQALDDHLMELAK
jgi:transaldolase